jgi:phenylacetate-coenzyme A ligase PaaK-like adenylate-forming protein
MNPSTTRATSGEVLHAIERASVDELRGLQLERLKRSLAHAYANSSFYRKHFDDHGVHSGRHLIVSATAT